MSLGGGAYFQERNEREGVAYDAPVQMLPDVKDVFGPTKADQENLAKEARPPPPAPKTATPPAFKHLRLLRSPPTPP